MSRSAGIEFLPSPVDILVCAYCRHRIITGKHRVCVRCTTTYHADCWLANGAGCAIYGCRPALQRTARPTGFRSALLVSLTAALLLVATLITLYLEASVEQPTPTPPAITRAIPKAALPVMESACPVVERPVLRREVILLKPAPSPAPVPEAAIVVADDAKAIGTRGILKVAQQDFTGGLTDLNEALRRNPRFADAHRHRAYAKDQMGDRDGALDDIRMAVQVNPRDGAAWRHLGTLLQRTGDLEGALAAYTHAVDIDPSDHTSWSGRGGIEWARRDLTAALGDLTRALDADPNDAYALNLRGHTFSELGSFERAAADFSRAIELDPDAARLYFDRGCARYNLRQWKECVPDFQAAAAKDPALRDEAQIRVFLARGRVGETKEALAQLTYYLLHHPMKETTPWARESLRFAARLLSEKEYLQRIPDASKACEAYFHAGTIRLLKGDRSGARALFDRALQTGVAAGDEIISARAELMALQSAP